MNNSIDKIFQLYDNSSKDEILDLLTKQTGKRSEFYLQGIQKRDQNLKRKKFEN